jgi:hypothetical protein
MPAAPGGKTTARARAATALTCSRRLKKWTPKALGAHFRNYPDPYDLKRRTLSVHEFNWGNCVGNFALEQTNGLAAERDVSELTIEGLRARELIGFCWVSKWKTECVSFPIHNKDGTVFRAHCRSPQRNRDGKWDWAYEPEKDPQKRPVPALVYGNPDTATKRMIFESQWDGISAIDKLNLFEEIDSGETCIIMTRGANFGDRLGAYQWRPGLAVYAFPQNDEAGDGWLANVLKVTRGAFVVRTPTAQKDLGDWVKAGGATTYEIEAAIDNAEFQQPANHLSGRTLLDFLDIAIDPKTNLAGNRWLTVDGSAFVIAPSGHGKSSLAIQLAICWAIGRIVFGIKPARSLRILIVQSEDDDAETKKFVQMIRKLKLNETEFESLRNNTRFEFQRSLTGDKFIKALDDWLAEWPADIVIINPLSGFLLCDLKDDEKVSLFLREKLSDVMAKHKCAPIVFHHTPKTNFTKLENMQWYDWMYAMSGCAGLTNWGRAVLVIAPSKLPGTYRFIAAKRFDEIQWTEREYWYSHSTEKISIDGEESTLVQWVPATSDQIKVSEPVTKPAKPKRVTAEIVLEKMSPIEWVTRPQFIEWAIETFSIGRDRADKMLTDLFDRDLVEILLTPRPKTNPKKEYRRKS